MGQGGCRNHPDKPATWRCVACGGLFCDACIHSQHLDRLQLNTCRVCRGKCERIVPADGRAAQERGFFARLPGAFVYPFKGSGIILLVMGGVLFWLMWIAVALLFAGLVVFFIAGYLCAYMLKIINATANGEDELPDWPRFADFWEDIVGPYFMVALTNLLSFLPAVLFFAYTVYVQAPQLPAFFALLGVGLFFLPMNLLTVAVFNSLAGLNPFRVIRAIAKTFGGYLVACAVISLIVALRVYSPILTSLIPVPVVGRVLEGILSFYLLTVEMRILGLLYRCYAKRLAWFETA